MRDNYYNSSDVYKCKSSISGCVAKTYMPQKYIFIYNPFLYSDNLSVRDAIKKMTP